MTRLGEPARQRWSVALRIVAGTLGSYGLTSLILVALSLLLTRNGMDPVESITAATLASFAIFAVIAMAAFHARSARRAWAWLISVAAPIAFLTWLLHV